MLRQYLRAHFPRVFFNYYALYNFAVGICFKKSALLLFKVMKFAASATNLAHALENSKGKWYNVVSL